MISDVGFFFFFGFQELHSVIHRHISIRHVPLYYMEKNCTLEKHMFLEVLKYVPEFANQRLPMEQIVHNCFLLDFH